MQPLSPLRGPHDANQDGRFRLRLPFPARCAKGPGQLFRSGKAGLFARVKAEAALIALAGHSEFNRIGWEALSN
jgi:hypothetical protein